MKIFFEGEGRSEAEQKEYRELLSLLAVTPSGKESRKLHKRLKAYGSRLDFSRRYPGIYPGVAAAALIVTVLGLLLHITGITFIS